MSLCYQCPRNCGIDRERSSGYCGEGSDAKVSKTMLHHFEEPCISGGEDGRGSGAIFFSGCSLRCVFCQNKDISRRSVGRTVTPKELGEEMIRLQDIGALNINLVTPTHFTDRIKEAIDLVRGRLTVPVVWNTSGYEKPEIIRSLKGYADVFLTDFKYFDPGISKRYSNAADYSQYASESLREMISIAGDVSFDGDIIERGVIVRHLVLPGAYRDSIRVLQEVASIAENKKILLSLMAQYTPEFVDPEYREIKRRITTYEYNKVLRYAKELGFDGYMQSRESASSSYTPDFKKEEI